MNPYLNSGHFPGVSETLSADLENLLQHDFSGNLFAQMGAFQRILADNTRQHQWPDIDKKLETLFACGKAVVLDGPMVGIPLCIRDSNYFQDTVRFLGRDQARIAGIEWMAIAWNMTFADTGLWMGKSFEPVSKETIAEKCENNARVMAPYDPEKTRIGRNFFREPPDPNLLQGISLPVLTQLWGLKDRPVSTSDNLFGNILTQANLEKEKQIQYTKTGGIYLADFGRSVLSEMNGKQVYQLNYRWPALKPVYPMTRLVDEIVQIADGIYLGCLIYAGRHYSLGHLHLPFCPDSPEIPIGEPYDPDHPHSLEALCEKVLHPGKKIKRVDYGYRNNGYFLMMDPAFSKEIYDDDAFPQLRPGKGESGCSWRGNKFDSNESKPAIPPVSPQMPDITDWGKGWQADHDLKKKFTTFIFEPSSKSYDPAGVQKWRKEDESILQMLQRISTDISVQTTADDRLLHFEKLNCLFRRGVAPVVENGLFTGHGATGFNTRLEGREPVDAYGHSDVAHGFDYYHGATLNLHLGFKDTSCPDPGDVHDQSLIFPSGLATVMGHSPDSPNTLDLMWHSIAKYIFPWAGKTFEKISGRKLSMLLDESPDLALRYPDRVKALESHMASAPHYDLVLKNATHKFREPGSYTEWLKSGSWDNGMLESDKAFWEKEAGRHWVDGNNTQDERILASDSLMRIIDMNYRVPDSSLQAVSKMGPSPFYRQGYSFLGTSEQMSVLPMNNGDKGRKTVFQFHYRYPMIGGPMPIGFCLDELVEIADGLFLGQLIYSTALHEPFHSSIDPAEYNYQLFGYFLLLDDAWQHHRLAIGLDTWKR